MFKTRYQVNTEAVTYNPKIAPLLEGDQDYCVRGMVTIEGFDLHCNFLDGMKEIQNHRLSEEIKNE